MDTEKYENTRRGQGPREEHGGQKKGGKRGGSLAHKRLRYGKNSFASRTSGKSWARNDGERGGVIEATAYNTSQGK